MRPPRILYMAGPGDVIGTYRHWRDGRDDPSQMHVAYSRQFFDLCERLGAEARVVSYHRDEQTLREGRFRLEHRRVPLQDRSGLAFHAGWIAYVSRLAWEALRWRADAIVAFQADRLFPYTVNRLFGTRVVPVAMCVLWPKLGAPKPIMRVVHALDTPLLKRLAEATVSMSGDVSDQIRSLTGRTHRPIVEFLPLYRERLFADALPRADGGGPFRVLFAGRVEAPKGVFDLLEAGALLRESCPRPVEFDVCGDGASLAPLRAAARERGLDGVFRCHGHCDHASMTRLLEESHCVVAPTRSDFIEGFNQVVVEAVLAWRPVVTSRVCPALANVRAAAVEAAPDDPSSYAEAIERLATDRRLYDEKVAACERCRAPFFDPGRSWGAVVESILRPSLGRQERHSASEATTTPTDLRPVGQTTA